MKERIIGRFGHMDINVIGALPDRCPTCNGKGTVTEMRHPFHTCHGIAHDVPCPDCGGDE